MFYVSVLCPDCLLMHKRNFVCVHQAELENKLQQQITLSAQELASESEKLAELQKNHKKAQENMEKLQLDIYGKESELLATQQDLKVRLNVTKRASFLSVFRKKVRVLTSTCCKIASLFPFLRIIFSGSACRSLCICMCMFFLVRIVVSCLNQVMYVK